MTDDISRMTDRLVRLLEEDKERARTRLTAGMVDRTKPIPPLEAIEMIEYPLGSREHPFDPLGQGRYFVHMCNRGTTISYLGDDLNDFSDTNDLLYRTIPMGYASLWVMQRTFLIDKNGAEFRWDFDESDKDCSRGENVLYLFVPNGALRYSNIMERALDNRDTKISFARHDAAVEFARKAIRETEYPIICGMRLASYCWH